MARVRAIQMLLEIYTYVVRMENILNLKIYFDALRMIHMCKVANALVFFDLKKSFTLFFFVPFECEKKVYLFLALFLKQMTNREKKNVIRKM